MHITAGTAPQSAKFKIGDEQIVVLAADIRMRPDEIITATIEVPVQYIDVELLTSGVTVEPIEQ